MFNATHVVATGGTFTVNYNEPQIPQTAIQFIFQNFGGNYVSTATHDNNDVLDAPKCHLGTRVSFLRRLSKWAKDAETSVYLTWLHGPAGAGKSAIARSLAESPHREGFMVVSYFFFRTDSRRNSEKPLIATLAYQIACNIPDIQPHIANAIAKDPAICSRSLQSQFDALIIKPFVQITTCESNSLQPILIILDGLDECVDQRARNLILKIIFDAFPHLLGYIRFLIVSRPEYDINRSIESATNSLGKSIDSIGLLGDLEAYDDVRVYLHDSFHRIKRTHPLREHFSSNWPSADAIEQLVEKSSGHFIYASTVVKYIENDFDQPQKCLDIVLNLRTTSQNPYATLDALYLNILLSSRADHVLLVNIFSIAILDGQWDKPNLAFRKGSMKSPGFIESILSLEPGGVQLALLDLRSLVGVNGVIEFWHKSFSDFLSDSSRSKEFYTSSACACNKIAMGCLQLLSDKPHSLNRLWSGLTYANPTIECHRLLYLSCQDTALNPDLLATIMKYEFDIIPINSSGNFEMLCSFLRNYQQASVFKGTRVFEHILAQFDRYLISELRHWVTLDSEIMDTLKMTILPSNINWTLFKKISLENPLIWINSDSCFLCYMYHEGPPYTEVILCDFFYSKDRACEYYLGESATDASMLSTSSASNGWFSRLCDPLGSLAYLVAYLFGIIFGFLYK